MKTGKLIMLFLANLMCFFIVASHGYEYTMPLGLMKALRLSEHLIVDRDGLMNYAVNRSWPIQEYNLFTSKNKELLYTFVPECSDYNYDCLDGDLGLCYTILSHNKTRPILHLCLYTVQHRREMDIKIAISNNTQATTLTIRNFTLAPFHFIMSLPSDSGNNTTLAKVNSTEGSFSISGVDDVRFDRAAVISLCLVIDALRTERKLLFAITNEFGKLDFEENYVKDGP